MGSNRPPLNAAGEMFSSVSVGVKCCVSMVVVAFVVAVIDWSRICEQIGQMNLKQVMVWGRGCKSSDFHSSKLLLELGKKVNVCV